MIVLLDANILIALSQPDHEHHAKANRWFSKAPFKKFATCPLTQLALVRISMQLESKLSFAEASRLLCAFTEHPLHQFWPDDMGVAEVAGPRIVGHRQLTDSYLAALCRKHFAKLATLDHGLAAIQTDVAILIAG
jgi:uncharacterized protein